MKYLVIAVSLLFYSSAFSQIDTLRVNADIDFNKDYQQEFPVDSTIIETTQLLPNHYLITQKVLWGEKGLIRYINGFELNEQNRLREVKWRSNMLKAHKILGYATIVGMAGMAYTGVKLYNGDRTYKDLHEGFATYTYATYFTSGGLMLFAPPWQTDRVLGYSNIKLHKYLSFLHMGLMATAIATAGGSENPGLIRNVHRASAFGAFGTYFVSTIIIEF